ncbi:MAG: phage holin family protein [Cytophagales bacterium]
MFSKIKENIEGYVRTRVELLKLEIEEQLVQSLGKLAKLMLLVIAGTLFFLFLSIAIAQIINTATQSNYWGYLLISLFYLIILVILYFYKNYDRLFQLYFANKTTQNDEQQP